MSKSWGTHEVAHRKTNPPQWNEVQCHKWKYDRCSKAVSLMMGDMVLVCVTAFKGRHKIQSRWVNREYVVEWQPYPNLPVYVACPIEIRECSDTLHRNYLLPINNNLEQEESENSVGADGSRAEITPVPHENDALPVNHLTKSKLEGIPNSPSKQHKPFDPGLTNTDPTERGFQADKDAPVPPRQSLRTTKNQPPWKYQNFALQQNAILPSAFNIRVGLCICLHLISCIHMVFMGNAVQEHSIWTTANLPNTQFFALMGYHPCQLCNGFLDGGRVDQRIFGLCIAAPLEKPRTTPHRGPMGVWAVQPWRQCAQ